MDENLDLTNFDYIYHHLQYIHRWKAMHHGFLLTLCIHFDDIPTSLQNFATSGIILWYDPRLCLTKVRLNLTGYDSCFHHFQARLCSIPRGELWRPKPEEISVKNILPSKNPTWQVRPDTVVLAHPSYFAPLGSKSASKHLVVLTQPRQLSHPEFSSMHVSVQQLSSGEKAKKSPLQFFLPHIRLPSHSSSLLQWPWQELNKF